jgi:hypothetical protein
VETPFGIVAAPGLSGPVEIVVRVESFRPTPDGSTRARVLDRRPQGASDVVRLEAGGTVWRGLVEASSSLAPGDETAVTLSSRGAHAFPISGE